MRYPECSDPGDPTLSRYRPHPPATARPAQHKRKPAHEVTADYEDAGLFPNAVCSVTVALTPQMRRNDRGDLIVRGIVDDRFEVDVFFAGRRTRFAVPLERRLRSLVAEARRKGGDDPLALNEVRLPVRIEGSWRRRTQRDASGWETGTHHLVAARWGTEGKPESAMQFGEPVVVAPVAEK